MMVVTHSFSFDSFVLRLKKIRCRFTVRGNHEPNVILKDNDLKYKLKLPGKLAREVRDQLEQDAIQLARMGIMDYSLLG